jgi:hypothetical protein
MVRAAFEPGDEAYAWKVALTLDDSDGLLQSDGGTRDCINLLWRHENANTSFDKKRARQFCLAGIFLFTALLCPTGNAQTAGIGSMHGAVADQTGAVLQDASVTIIDTATGVKHKTTSGADSMDIFRRQYVKSNF